MKKLLNTTRKNTQSYPKTKRKLKKVFNEYIRLRDAGMPCICCGKFNTLQAGHYISVGSSGSLEFNEDNVHGQCAYCNMRMQETKEVYRINLIDRIGVERVIKLEALAKVKVKRTRLDLEWMIEHYQKKIKALGNSHTTETNVSFEVE